MCSFRTHWYLVTKDFFFLSTSLYPLQSICNSLKNFNINLLLPPLHAISISNYDLNYKFSFWEWEVKQWLQKTESAEFEFLWKFLTFPSNISKKVINPALPVDISMPDVLTKVSILLYYVNCHFSWARDFSCYQYNIVLYYLLKRYFAAV